WITLDSFRASAEALNALSGRFYDGPSVAVGVALRWPNRHVAESFLSSLNPGAVGPTRGAPASVAAQPPTYALPPYNRGPPWLKKRERPGSRPGLSRDRRSPAPHKISTCSVGRLRTEPAPAVGCCALIDAERLRERLDNEDVGDGFQ